MDFFVLRKQFPFFGFQCLRRTPGIRLKGSVFLQKGSVSIGHIGRPHFFCLLLEVSQHPLETLVGCALILTDACEITFCRPKEILFDDLLTFPVRLLQIACQPFSSFRVVRFGTDRIVERLQQLIILRHASQGIIIIQISSLEFAFFYLIRCIQKLRKILILLLAGNRQPSDLFFQFRVPPHGLSGRVILITDEELRIHIHVGRPCYVKTGKIQLDLFDLFIDLIYRVLQTELTLGEILDRCRKLQTQFLGTEQCRTDPLSGIPEITQFKYFLKYLPQLLSVSLINRFAALRQKGMITGTEALPVTDCRCGDHTDDLCLLLRGQGRRITEIDDSGFFVTDHDIAGMEVAMIKAFAEDTLLHPLFGHLDQIALAFFQVLKLFGQPFPVFMEVAHVVLRDLEPIGAFVIKQGLMILVLLNVFPEECVDLLFGIADILIQRDSGGSFHHHDSRAGRNDIAQLHGLYPLILRIVDPALLYIVRLLPRSAPACPHKYPSYRDFCRSCRHSQA